MKWFFLLYSFSCFGQLPVIPWTVTPSGGLVGSPIFTNFLHQNAARNDFTGNVGVTLTSPGTSSFHITALGLWVITGDSNKITVLVWKNSNIIASNVVDTSLGPRNTFAYTSISPVAVSTVNTDRLFIEFKALTGSDPWLNCTPNGNQYGIDQSGTSGGGFTTESSVNETPSVCVSGNQGYGIPNFLFTVP